MSNVNSYEDAVSRLASQSDAVGRLAQDNGGFAAVVAAFEAKDANAFRWVLERLEMLPYCELICEWVRIKFGVLRCLEVCGLPAEKVETPSLQQFARAIVQLASNEKLLRQVVDSISCGDGEEYRATIAELKLNNFCYLLCHWVYSVVYHRVCEVVCSPDRVPLGDAVSEIRAAAKEISGILENEKAFDVISEAAVALNCETLRSAIDQFGLGPQCGFICRLICSWRYVWVCREFCQLRTPRLAGANGIEEAQDFAMASHKLASHPRALADLVSAVRNRDGKTFGEIIDRFGLGPYCYQVCAWVCSVTCHRFCICVCPPSANPPLFTQVGNFDIYSQIDPITGLTNTHLTPTAPMPFGGGPNFAFFEQLQLGGWCPATSPAFPGQAMMYRFLYAYNQTTLASPITSAGQNTITVTSNAGIPPTPFNISVCYSDAPYETAEIMTVNIATTTTWTVVRGVDGTTAATSVPAGATVAINPQPITNALVDKPIQVGQRTISWPNHSGTTTLPGFTPTLEPVYVGPGTDPTPPPVGPGTYVDPAHYIQPDSTTGWVDVDQSLVAGGISIFLWFDSAKVTPAVCELVSPPCFGTPGGAPAGTAVPVANQGVGTDLTIIFQATRQTVSTIDYSNSLCQIHVNNFPEVNNLWFVEFDTPGTTCCTPINSFLSAQFTADHEMMYSGGWSLEITSCALTSGLNITPTVAVSAQSTTLTSAINNTTTSIPVASVAGFPSTPFILVVGTEIMMVTGVSPGSFTVVRGENGTAAAALLGATATYPGLTLTSRGGAGTVVENTTGWTNCSYQVWLSARAGLTSGLLDSDPGPNLLTFCICGHDNLPAPAAESQANTASSQAKKR
jgi:hypothetical protein